VTIVTLKAAVGFDRAWGFTVRFNGRIDFPRGRDDPPAPAKPPDLNANRFEIGHGPLHFLLSAADGTLCDEVPVVPAGPLVPPTSLLLLTSVERMIPMVAVPKVVLSLLVAETAITLVPAEVAPTVLVVRGVSAVAPLAGGQFLFTFIDP